MVIRDMRPISWVKGPGARDMLNALSPRYSPMATATVRKYMAAMFKARRHQIKTALAPLRSDKPPAARGLSACLITDDWGARNGKSFNAVLATTLDDDFVQEQHCLSLTEFESAHHTAEVLTTKLTETLSFGEYNLPVSAIFRTVHDAGSNIKKGPSPIL